MKLIVEDFSKNDVQEIFSDMMQEFLDYSDDLDFCTDAIIDQQVKWTRSNATRKLGHCKLVGTDYRGGREIKLFEIALNPILLQYEDTDLQMIKDVIAHEFCHTLPNCQNHGKEFHNKARLIGSLMGYKIDTKADEESSKVFMSKLNDNAPYLVKCENCGTEMKFPKLIEKVKESYKYRCTKCGKAALMSYKLNKKTGEYQEFLDRQMIDAFRSLFIRDEDN